jgi:threonine/homoserine/homoserine lactone efflux protein
MSFFDARFGAYLAVAALLIMTPGPDTALVTRNALLAGRPAAAFTILGIGAGSVAWAVASVGGIAVLLEQSALAFTVFKLAGAAYLGYLGLRSLLGGHRGANPTPAGDLPPQEPALARQTSFRQGLLSNLLNPKAGAIFATALPQFIVPGDSPARLALMLIAYEAILLIWLNIYAALVSRAGQSRIGVRLRAWMQRVTGAVLIALGVRLAFERR